MGEKLSGFGSADGALRSAAASNLLVGKANAITATARKLALLVYRALSGKLAYHEPGTTKTQSRA